MTSIEWSDQDRIINVTTKKSRGRPKGSRDRQPRRRARNGPTRRVTFRAELTDADRIESLIAKAHLRGRERMKLSATRIVLQAMEETLGCKRMRDGTELSVSTPTNPAAVRPTPMPL